MQTWCSTFECIIVADCLQIWRQLFSPLHCLNFGVGGDATQHVLWRLSNGELDNISPKVQNSARNREHDHACLFTQKTDCVHLDAKIPLPGALTPNYQRHVFSHALPCLLLLQVVVLWVGTNNHGHTPEQICGGILAIIQVIKNKLPSAHTLVLVGFVLFFSPNACLIGGVNLLSCMFVEND